MKVLFKSLYVYNKGGKIMLERYRVKCVVEIDKEVFSSSEEDAKGVIREEVYSRFNDFDNVVITDKNIIKQIDKEE